MRRAYLLLSGFLLLALSNANAYVLYSWNSLTPRWNSLSPSFVIDITNGPAGALSAIQAGLQAWTDVSTSALNIQDGGTTTAGCTQQDGIYTVCFGDPGGGALGRNYVYWNGSAQITDTDTIICQSCDWSSYDLQSVAVHEIGHAVPLDHSADTTATMYTTLNPGETGFRTLAQDDIAGITYLYPWTFATGTPVAAYGVSVGNSYTQTLTITANANAFTRYGTGGIRITSISVGGTNAAEFTTSNDTCTNQLFTTGGGESCTIDITFSPATSSAKSATLSVVGNGPDGTNSFYLYGNDNSIVPSVTEYGLLLLVTLLLVSARFFRRTDKV